MNAFLLSLNPEANVADQWDFGFVRDFLEGRMWQTPGWQDFTIVQTEFLPMVDRAIVVLPARHHADMVEQINDEIGQIKHVVLFLLGDEEASFPVEKLRHKSLHVWVQNPHMGRHDKYNKLGTGYPTHIHDHLPTERIEEVVDKPTDIFFAGQITHLRRKELTTVMEALPNAELVRTKGFTQGLPKDEYYAIMSSTKLAPAPSGAVIPDSFRLFEALECMAIPVADEVLPTGETWHYWDWLFGEITPFPKITNWDALYELSSTIDTYQTDIHQQTAWWIAWKRKFAYKVMEQLNGL